LDNEFESENSIREEQIRWYFQERSTSSSRSNRASKTTWSNQSR